MNLVIAVLCTVQGNAVSNSCGATLVKSKRFPSLFQWRTVNIDPSSYTMDGIDQPIASFPIRASLAQNMK